MRTWIDRGCHVLPLQARRKTPVRPCAACGRPDAPCKRPGTACPCWPSTPCHGVRSATNDPEVTAAWWRRWPSAGVGIATGPSGLVVVDLDAHGQDAPAVTIPTRLGIAQPAAPRSGVDVYRHVAEALSGDPRGGAGYYVRTPSGGLHLYWTTEADTYRSSAGRVTGDHVTGLGWSVDVRAGGGYVVAPDVTVTTGVYTAMSTGSPRPVPTWLAGWLAVTGHRVDQLVPRQRAASPVAPRSEGRDRGERYALAALADESDRLSTMAPGGRNAQLNRAAYSLGGYVAAGHLAEEAVIVSLTAAAEACGLPPVEAAATIRSGLSAGLRRPRAIPAAGGAR